MRLCIARQVGWGMECPDVATWLSMLMVHLVRSGIEVEMQQITKGRISMARNRAVEYARRNGCDYLLMIDPDIVADRYVRVNRQGEYQADERGRIAVPFFQTASKLLLEHDGPAIAAAPYRGRTPQYPVHVFATNAEGQRQRVSNEQADRLRGWQRVLAVGTGLVLMPMTLFDKLDQKLGRDALPYFHDVYSDVTQTALTYSQDIAFCLKCHDVGIPIFVNFDCWCGHWQNAVVEAPGREEPMEHAILPKEEALQRSRDTTSTTVAASGSCGTPSTSQCQTTCESHSCSASASSIGSLSWTP